MSKYIMVIDEGQQEQEAFYLIKNLKLYHKIIRS